MAVMAILPLVVESMYCQFEIAFVVFVLAMVKERAPPLELSLVLQSDPLPSSRV